jgi:hypothetical protein
MVWWSIVIASCPEVKIILKAAFQPPAGQTIPKTSGKSTGVEWRRPSDTRITPINTSVFEGIFFLERRIARR